MDADLLIIHGDLFTMTGEGTGYVADGAVAVRGNSILEVGTTAGLLPRYRPGLVIDASSKAVLPGLIDAHLHSAIALLRGVGQDAHSWHASMDPYFQAMTVDGLVAGAMLTVIEAVRAGTTTICDQGPGVSLSLPFYIESGVRACVSSLISEAPTVESGLKEGELLPFDRQAGEMRLIENLGLLEDWRGAGSGRISAMLGPQAADYCGEEMLGKVRDLAEKHDCKIHMHLCQDDREIFQVGKRHGVRPVQLLKKLGLLGPRLIAAHLVKCTGEEVEEVARSGASMAFCPSSLLICDGILPPADIFIKAGGPVGLGTDETGSNNGANLFSEMKMATLALKMKTGDPGFCPAWKALRMATIEGAAALGMERDIGSLEAGKKADIILVDLNRPSLSPVFREPVRNIVPNLVLSARGDEVCMSIIDGRIVYENGKITSFDEDEAMSRVRRAAEEINGNASPGVAHIDTPQYRYTRRGLY